MINSITEHTPQVQSRRAFLRRIGHLSAAGVAAPWALNLATMGEAAAFTATDYKALVCVFLYGGNDHNNTYVPYDEVNYNIYKNFRTGIYTPRADLINTILNPTIPLPNNVQFALAPQWQPLISHFNATQKMAVVLNVGTLNEPTSKAQYTSGNHSLPLNLFSHNDQQSVWQSGNAEGAASGYGGRIGDMAMANNGQATFTCINASSNAIYLTGNTAQQYQIGLNGAIKVNGLSPNGVFGSSTCTAALQTLITQQRDNYFERDYNAVSARSVTAESSISAALSQTSSYNPSFTSSNDLAAQLKIVARLINAHDHLATKRQVFMVGVGGFDMHDFIPQRHPEKLAGVAQAMNEFQTAMNALYPDKVTTFTASDFGRTLASNGDGSDHGWGSHHIVLGGAVKGGRFYGEAPILDMNGTNTVGGGRLLPSLATDQYLATMAKWFGVTASEMPTVFPRLANFSTSDLGFML